MKYGMALTNTLAITVFYTPLPDCGIFYIIASQLVLILTYFIYDHVNLFLNSLA